MSLKRSLRHQGLAITGGQQLAVLICDELERQGISHRRFSIMCGGTNHLILRRTARQDRGIFLETALAWVDGLELRLTWEDQDLTSTVQACALLDARRLQMRIPVTAEGKPFRSTWIRARGIGLGKYEIYGKQMQLSSIVQMSHALGVDILLRPKPKVSKRNIRLAAHGIKPMVVSQLNKKP